MAGNRPEVDTEEFIQSRLERQIREQCELHGWATAVSVANPVDILIMFEEQDEDFDPKTLKIVSKQSCQEPKRKKIPLKKQLKSS